MFKSYLKNARKTIIVVLICTLIFSVVFDLYNLPVMAVIYGFSLCSIFLVVIFSINYIKYVRKIKLFNLLNGAISFSIDRLPQPENIIENNYNKLLLEFNTDFQNIIYKTKLSKTEMMDFYTLWVHQIKTPISAISLLLQEDNAPQNKQIAQELFKIEQYTELVLGYLRIEDLSIDLMLKEYTIDKIINQAVKKYAMIFIHKKIGIEISNTDKTVITDEKWLRFVIEQLLSNALKYTNNGKIKIYMQCNNLIIEDTGIGITHEDLPRIFEKSFTGFNGRMDEKSTGLGLYLCKKTLDKLNHKITIQSNQGVGTTVIIDLSQSNIVHE